MEPEFLAPPPQRKTPEARPFPTKLLEMSATDAELHIVRDIAKGPAESWRWSGQNPTVRLHLVYADGLKYHLDFAIADDTFKVTGPVTLTFQVNGKPLASQRFDTPGHRVWEAPVPPGLLTSGDDNTLGVMVDKVWASPGDGSRLGIIILNIGLVN